ncbi:MAG: hypothetical protein WC455_07080 [Dehalococcoidia bacterium]|jgi:hypothetical protein
MIRAIYRTDVLSFFFSSPLERHNEAISREVPGRGNFFSPEVFLEHWLPLKGRRRTWVTDEDGRINSLISVKSNKESKIWYVDYLQASDEKHCYALLEYVGASAARRGVRKLFINLSVNSTVIDVARRAGFTSYNTYYIYKYGNRSVPRSVPAPEQYAIRVLSKGEEVSLYTLYNSSAPLAVRSAEGLTFEEWQDRSGCCSWFEHRTELLAYRRDTLEGFLRISFSGRTGCFEIIFRHIEGVGLEWLVNHALNCLGGKAQIFSIVSVAQWQLRGMLENSQFEQVSKFEAMIRENVIRVEEPQFIPMRA